MSRMFSVLPAGVVSVHGTWVATCRQGGVNGVFQGVRWGACFFFRLQRYNILQAKSRVVAQFFFWVRGKRLRISLLFSLQYPLCPFLRGSTVNVCRRKVNENSFKVNHCRNEVNYFSTENKPRKKQLKESQPFSGNVTSCVVSMVSKSVSCWKSFFMSSRV